MAPSSMGQFIFIVTEEKQARSLGLWVCVCVSPAELLPLCPIDSMNPCALMPYGMGPWTHNCPERSRTQRWLWYNMSTSEKGCLLQASFTVRGRNKTKQNQRSKWKLWSQTMAKLIITPLILCPISCCACVNIASCFVSKMHMVWATIPPCR